MATNLGNISNLLSTPTAQIDDGNDAIHSAIIMYLNAASGENRAISGFDITQGTTSSHTHYAVTAGSILRNGKLVYVNSNVIDAALYFSKKKQKKFEIFLGNNSSNKFIARRLWYIKNFLPSIFGGFDNEVRIKDLNFK